MTSKPELRRHRRLETSTSLSRSTAGEIDRGCVRTEPGRDAGRLVDGHWFAQDGRDPVWTPPRWIRILESQGYDRTTEGEPYFVVSEATRELATLGSIRAAFRFVLDRVGTSCEGTERETLTIDCRTPSGRVVRVVQGRSVIGMARGALRDEPITIIEAPAD